MFHQCQRLPLRLESCNHALRVHAELNDLERYAPTHRLFLLGQVNHAATAFAQLLEELVPPNPVGGLFGRRDCRAQD